MLRRLAPWLVLVFALTGSAFAEESDVCAHVLSTSRAIINGDQFRKTRGQAEYERMLGGVESELLSDPRALRWPDGRRTRFADALLDLSQGSKRYLDSGGGDGIAAKQIQTAARNPDLHVTLLSWATPAQPGPGFDVLRGVYLEEASLPARSMDLITDVYGPFAYSSQPDLVLRRYLDFLRDDGQLFIYLGSPHDTPGRSFYQNFGSKSVIESDGQRMNLMQWLRTLPGLDVRLLHAGGGSWTAWIRLADRAAVHIPQLRAISVSGSQPPVYHFLAQ